jgi:hypothetical protein
MQNHITLLSIPKLYALRYTIRVDCKIREADPGGNWIKVE